MSALLGTDSRRLDAVAQRLLGHSQDLQTLRILAQRAVAEMRGSWYGPVLAMTSQRWEHEAERRLTDVSTALSLMAGVVRAQADQQRHTSRGAVWPAGDHHLRIDSPGPDDVDVRQRLIQGKEHHKGEGTTHHGQPGPDRSVNLTVAHRESEFQASALSLQGGNQNAEYELSAAKAEATAGYSLDVDDRGNVVASASASAAAYLGLATGRVHGGNDLVNGSAGSTAFVGVKANTDASGSLGRDGAEGHLGAQAFAGADAEVDATGSAGGVTAAAGAEISFGIGAHANVDADLSSAKVGILMDLGVTLGVGAGGKLDVSVSPKELIASAQSAVDQLGDPWGEVGEGSASR